MEGRKASEQKQHHKPEYHWNNLRPKLFNYSNYPITIPKLFKLSNNYSKIIQIIQ